VVLADEPIASLEPESSRKVMDILALGDHSSSLEDKARPVPHLAWPAPLAQAA